MKALAGIRSMIPPRPAERSGSLTAWEWVGLFVANLVVTFGIIGDIARHLTDEESLNEPFLAGWHLVLFGGVGLVGLWLGVLALRRGPEFLWNVPTVVMAFASLSVSGTLDGIWHTVLGTERELEALVSPPHMMSMLGLVLLLSSPVAILWHQPGRLGHVRSGIVAAGAVSALVVALMFSGYASVFAGGFGGEPDEQSGFVWPETTLMFDADFETDGALVGPGDEPGPVAPSRPDSESAGDLLPWSGPGTEQVPGEPTPLPPWVTETAGNGMVIDYIPVVGESSDDYDVAMGMATVAWTSVVLGGVFALIAARFRFTPGVFTVSMAAVGAGLVYVSGAVPPGVALAVFGAVFDTAVFLTRSWSRRAAVIVSSSVASAALWLSLAAAVAVDRGLEWTAPLWAGTATTGALVAAAVAWAVTTPVIAADSEVPDGSL